MDKHQPTDRWHAWMTDLVQHIADLEAEIDSLSDAAEQCRKSMIVAKAAVVAGILLFGASLLGLIRSDPIILVIGIAVTIAGIGFFGSSRGSLGRLQEKIQVREARRNEMIDGMGLRAVEDQ
jgi:cell division septum initiation protein DivIVA